MIRYFVIAARNHADLYAYLYRQFAGDETVQVLADRRQAERRRHVGFHITERRRGERRLGLGQASDLATYGFLVVREAAGLQWQPPWRRPVRVGKASELDRRQDARYLARLIVGMIILYHRDKITSAIKNDALFDVLARELEDGRRYYQKNADLSGGAGMDYFDQAVVDMLVKEHGNVESKIW